MVNAIMMILISTGGLQIVLVCLSVDSLRRVVLAQWKVSFQGIYFQSKVEACLDILECLCSKSRT